MKSAKFKSWVSIFHWSTWALTAVKPTIRARWNRREPLFQHSCCEWRSCQTCLHGWSCHTRYGWSCCTHHGRSRQTSRVAGLLGHARANLDQSRRSFCQNDRPPCPSQSRIRPLLDVVTILDCHDACVPGTPCCDVVSCRSPHPTLPARQAARLALQSCG